LKKDFTTDQIVWGQLLSAIQPNGCTPDKKGGQEAALHFSQIRLYRPDVAAIVFDGAFGCGFDCWNIALTLSRKCCMSLPVSMLPST
jgi:hypothetical protein